MNPYSICTDIYTIVAGTNNTLSPVFKEAANNIENATPKGFGYIKNFIISIEELSNTDEVKDSRISESKGNIKAFKSYKNIELAISFLNKYLKNIPTVKECTMVLDGLEKYQPLYTEAYEKNTRLVVLEYENAVYLLVTTLSMLLANNMDVVSNGSEIRVQKKSATTFGVIPETLTKLAKELSDRNHKEYLETMIKKSAEVGKEHTNSELKESVYMETVIGDTLELIHSIYVGTKKIGTFAKNTFKAVKKSLFGIIPLIRSIIFLRYKKKADTIVSLEEQIEFIQENIEHLENRKNIDPEKKIDIIKKQKAVVEAYKKKAEKLRAELCEQEKEASVEIKKDNEEIKEVDDDDDYVLEHVIFSEASKLKKRNRITPSMKKKVKRTPSEIKEMRRERLEEERGFWIFKSRKQKEEEKRKEEETEGNKKIIEEKAKRIAKKILDETAVPAIDFSLGKIYKSDDPKRRTDTKIGGIPYWPKNMKWPINRFDNEPMLCIAQLNFDKLPKLEGYPTTGLLQFFINHYIPNPHGDDYVCKVVYHKTYDSTELLEDVPRSTLPEHASVEEWLEEYSVIEGVWYPDAKIIETGINWCCDHSIDGKFDKVSYDDYVLKYANEEFGTDWKTMKEVPDEISKSIDEAYDSINDRFGSRIGGWPYSIQCDPRDKNHSVPLLMLDSFDDFMVWGDYGISNFFISKENLSKKNFNDVLWYWDCY